MLKIYFSSILMWIIIFEATIILFALLYKKKLKIDLKADLMLFMVSFLPIIRLLVLICMFVVINDYHKKRTKEE